MEDATIEVLDNEGNVVEVKAVNLVAGETTATFTFTKALTEDPEGVWNVGGVEVDLDLAANLKAVYTASTQVKLLEGLNKLGLTDVKAENIAHYELELAKVKDSTKDTYIAEADFTLEDAQAVVTEGNKAALESADETAIVKAVNDAKTQVALLEALASFERVNAEWIADYDVAVGGAVVNTTVKNIQVAIDGVNAGKVNPKVVALNLDAATASIVKKDLNEAKTLVTSYQKPDGAGETAKTEVLRKIDRQLAVIAVLDAETPAQLTVAINALKAVDAAYELNMDNYKDANRAAYITALNAVGPFNTIAKINAELIVVNGTEVASAPTAIKTAGAAITDVTGTITDAQKSNLLKALKAYTDVKYVADANADAYAELAGTLNVNKFGVLTIAAQTPAQIKAAVQALVDEANLAAIQSAVTADEVYAALVAYGNDIKDLSVNNKAQYLTDIATFITNKATVQLAVDASNITALQAQTTADGVLAKLAIMTQVKNVKAENAAAYLYEVTDVAGTIKVITTKTIANLQTAINDVNTAAVKATGVKALNAATTATEVRDILTELVVNGSIAATDYLNASSADKLIIAELFMDDDVFASSTTGLVATRAAKFGKYNEVTVATGLREIQTDLAALATAAKAEVTAVDTAFKTKTPGVVTIANAQALLDGLTKMNYTAYDELTATQQLAVAEAFIAAYPTFDNSGVETYKTNAYTSISAYFAAVDAAIAE